MQAMPDMLATGTQGAHTHVTHRLCLGKHGLTGRPWLSARLGNALLSLTPLCVCCLRRRLGGAFCMQALSPGLGRAGSRGAGCPPPAPASSPSPASAAPPLWRSLLLSWMRLLLLTWLSHPLGSPLRSVHMQLEGCC